MLHFTYFPTNIARASYPCRKTVKWTRSVPLTVGRRSWTHKLKVVNTRGVESNNLLCLILWQGGDKTRERIDHRKKKKSVGTTNFLPPRTFDRRIIGVKGLAKPRCMVLCGLIIIYVRCDLCVSVSLSLSHPECHVKEVKKESETVRWWIPGRTTRQQHHMRERERERERGHIDGWKRAPAEPYPPC